MTDKTEAQPEALRLADERPCSIDDDLYAWSQSAEQMIRDQHAEIQQLKAQLADETETSSEWRRLALQFDGHRIQALSHLKLLTKHPSDHRAAAASFLAAPPLSGEQVLADRLTRLSTRQAPPDEHVAFETWAENHYPDIDLEREADGYRHSLAQEWWDAWRARAMLSAAPHQPEREPQKHDENRELAETAMRFVDRAGDVHPGIDDADRICAEFHAAMMEVIEKWHPMPMPPGIGATND